MPLSLGITCYRLPTLTPDEFKDLYESKHVPLIRRLIGDGDAAPLSYRRHYLNRTPPDAEGGGSKPRLLVGDVERADWDCLVEVTFRDEEHFQKYMAAYGQNAKTIADHGATFLDQKRALVASYATEGL